MNSAIGERPVSHLSRGEPDFSVTAKSPRRILRKSKHQAEGHKVNSMRPTLAEGALFCDRCILPLYEYLYDADDHNALIADGTCACEDPDVHHDETALQISRLRQLLLENFFLEKFAQGLLETKAFRRFLLEDSSYVNVTSTFKSLTYGEGSADVDGSGSNVKEIQQPATRSYNPPDEKESNGPANPTPHEQGSARSLILSEKIEALLAAGVSPTRIRFAGKFSGVAQALNNCNGDVVKAFATMFRVGGKMLPRYQKFLNGEPEELGVKA